MDGKFWFFDNWKFHLKITDLLKYLKFRFKLITNLEREKKNIETHVISRFVIFDE